MNNKLLRLLHYLCAISLSIVILTGCSDANQSENTSGEKVENQTEEIIKIESVSSYAPSDDDGNKISSFKLILDKKYQNSQLMTS